MLFIYFFFLTGFGDGMLPALPKENSAETVHWKKESMNFSGGNSKIARKDFRLGRTFDSIASYDAEKATIAQLRKQLINDLAGKKVSIEDVKASFSDHLVNHLIPHWYGTEWSFGGHTSVPKKGKIACGYFVSTTLRDMGLRLNRYRLAQKSPINEAKMISCGSEIKTVTSADSETAIQKIDALTQEGISFIGFDEGHVGFLLKKKGELFLVHSNYLFPNSVCLERIEESNVFKKFSTFHLVDISNNNELIKRWLNNREIL
ncbi:hypothetical protein [Costertonia aggregata]|uniref:Uncharacterized protein n=1 Tax=Costertonia aggregata TaxID=343403 RepID=A0A7H9ASQ8_9FLAO|nr:hypothetical protein [Costertonia aggregata]QLG46518.1 hypothetical protein HYG79_14570 [Costertonia aggregata]